MEILMYIYSNKLPLRDLVLYRCIKCTRPLFKANSDKIVISNALGASHRELPPYTSMIEHQCHSCKTVYQILFQ